MIAFNISGTADAIAALRGLPSAVQNRISRRALEFAATPIVRAAKQLATPAGPRNRKAPHGIFATTGVRQFGKHGSIKKAIIRNTTTNNGVTVVHVGTLKAAFWANFVHSGTKSHSIKIARGPLAGRVVNHPGSKGNQFLLKAIEIARPEAVARLAAKLDEGIKKYAASKLKKR